MPRVRDKKRKLYIECATSSEKSDSAYHISKNVQSDPILLALEECYKTKFLQEPNPKFFLLGQNENCLILLG